MPDLTNHKQLTIRNFGVPNPTRIDLVCMYIHCSMEIAPLAHEAHFFVGPNIHSSNTIVK